MSEVQLFVPLPYKATCRDAEIVQRVREEGCHIYSTVAGALNFHKIKYL